MWGSQGQSWALESSVYAVFYAPYACQFIYTYIYIYIYICVCVCTTSYLYTYICMHVCVCVGENSPTRTNHHKQRLVVDPTAAKSCNEFSPNWSPRLLNPLFEDRAGIIVSTTVSMGRGFFHSGSTTPSISHEALKCQQLILVASFSA